MKKKILPFLAGVLVGAVIGGAVVGAVLHFQNNSENEEIVLDGEEEYQEEPAVFSESGNLKISDEAQNITVEIIPPAGFTASEEESSLFGGEYYSEDASVGASYYIGEYTSEEMTNYYDEYIAFMTSEEMGGGYSDVKASEVKEMEANGYKVNYIEFSYTYGDESEQEKYKEYTAFVNINERQQLICSLYGYEGEITEELIKECFDFEIPIQ